LPGAALLLRVAWMKAIFRRKSLATKPGFLVFVSEPSGPTLLPQQNKDVGVAKMLA
jgi:hypothetical protein